MSKKINIKEVANSLDKEEFINYYKEHNLIQTQEKFNISSQPILKKVINYFGIIKSKEDIKKTRLNTAIAKYGSLESYLKIKNERASKAQLSKTDEEKKLIEAKKVKTNLERYGVSQPSQKDDYAEIRRKNIESKGITYEEYYKDINKKVKETKQEKYGDPNYNNIVKYSKTCQEKFGVPYACMREEARKFNSDSKPNKLFSKLLDNNNIKYIREFNLNSYSYDFKIDNILIEINPFATHNSTWGLFERNGKDPNYHLNKAVNAFKNNYRCINIWDWDDINKIINLLKDKEIIYARKCEIKEVDKQDAYSFISLNHLQNNCNNQKIFCGLYYKNNLIQIMTFGKPRYNKNYEYELLRLCTDSSYKVVGGSERLFKYFLNTYNPSSIISYCDNSKFKGNVYEKLGFNLLNKPKPSKHWYNPKSNIHITDNLLRQKGFDRLLGKYFGNYGKGFSNQELMLNHNFVEIYDCGQSTYIYINNKGEK